MVAERSIDERLARRYIVEHPTAAAQRLERLAVPEAASALASAPEGAALVLEHMDRSTAAACLLRMAADERTVVLASLRADIAARLLRTLAPEDQEAILAGCAPSVARPLRRLLSFPEGTAGALMDPKPWSAPRDITVAMVLERVERGAGEVLYVVERTGSLAGMIPTRDLLEAPADALLESRMASSVPRIGARAERDAILAHPAWQEHHLLPVVDRHEVLIGVLRYPTMRALQAELADPPVSISFALALSEMYWTMMSALVQGVVRALPARPPAQGEPR